MLYFVFIAVFFLLNVGPQAVGGEEISSMVCEVKRTDENCKCSNITELLESVVGRLDVLASDLTTVKAEITSRIPTQLQTQSTEIESLKKIVGNSSCPFDLSKLESSLGDVINRTARLSESLLLHDTRLQTYNRRVENMTAKSECNFTVTPMDCSDIKAMGFFTSGVYRIFPNPARKDFKAYVYCDFDTPGGSWLVFQRRKDGSLNFENNWKDYANGFGHPNGEFWLGNEILHHLTSNRKYKLRIDLESFENQKRFAEYSTFSVGPPSDFFRLTVDQFYGNAGDGLSIHNDQQFSTFDVDRDQNSSSCAQQFHGGWWYKDCHTANLNGKYLSGVHTFYAEGIEWYPWLGYFYSLKSTEMKIA